MLGPRDAHCLGQGGRESGQNLDGLAYVAVRGRDADAEPGSELGVCVTATQMGQSEESLTTGSQTPSPGPDLPSPHGESSGRVPQSATGQVDRRRVDKHTKFLADGGSRS